MRKILPILSNICLYTKALHILFLLSFCSLLYGQFDPGQVGNSQTLCYRSAPEALAFMVQPSGGNAPYTFRWQRSNDGTTWNDITGLSAAKMTYSPPVLGRTTWFRCIVTDDNSVSLLTDIVTIYVANDLNAGIIEDSQTIYSGTEPTPLIEVTAPSGGGGSYSYRWQSSRDGLNWSDIQGANSPNFSPSAIIQDTWFRRLVTDGLCGSTSSNSVIITTTLLSIYTSEIPDQQDINWGIDFDFGTAFKVLKDGLITKARLFCGVNEGGPHQIRIWSQNDQGTFDLVLGPIEWNFTAGTSGWREFTLPSPFRVKENQNYIISITTGSDNQFWSQDQDFIPLADNSFITYLGTLRISPPGNAPNEYIDAGLFRDIVFIPFSAGSAGVSQSICYNTVPTALTQAEPPSGAAGDYTYKWESSTNSISWTNIQGAISPDYSPPAMTENTYFRRVITSGGFSTYSSPVLINVNPQFNTAQIHDNINIYENTATNLNVVLTGGTPPYMIEYTRNNITQDPVPNYTSGTDIYTGVLASGSYLYELTSVSDAFGCEVESHGSPANVNVSGPYMAEGNTKALVVVNSQKVHFSDFAVYIKPYLDWFGIPYESCDIASTALPDLTNFSVIIFGHRNVYESDYPISELESAITSGAGLYSFDPHLFDFPSAFNVSGTMHEEVTSSQIDIVTDHYITRLHEADIYNPSNNVINLNEYGAVQQTITVNQSSYRLAGTPATLAAISDGEVTEPLLQATTVGNGRIVKWSSYDWVFDYKLGPVWGMDDLIWRGIVWAAKKPFVMQGMPPMITMRVDDVDGTRSMEMEGLEWLRICNEFGLIPWMGIFLESESEDFYDTLRYLIDHDLATASPHAFNYEDLIFFNLNNDPQFSAEENVIEAQNFFITQSLTMSKYLVAHHYLLSSDALAAIKNMGIEFIGTRIPCDRIPGVNYPGEWLNCGPYKIDRDGWGGPGVPYFYGGFVNWSGIDFFISLTEIGDDGGYEWYPIFDQATNIARGVRHLRRALNSMVLPVLFTHENQILASADEWRETIGGITSAISSYNPEYRSTDYAAKYIRAKENINITNVTADDGLVTITCSGVNDLSTKCYVFTESAGQISFRLIALPIVSSSTESVIINVLE